MVLLLCSILYFGKVDLYNLMNKFYLVVNKNPLKFMTA